MKKNEPEVKYSPAVKQMIDELKAKLSTGPLKELFAAREKAEKRLDNLQASLIAEVDKKDKFSRSYATALDQLIDSVAEGGSNEKSSMAKVRQIESEMKESEILLGQIEKAHHTGSAALTEINEKLKEAVRVEVLKIRATYETRMDDLISQAMQIFDQWIDSTRVVYSDLKLDFYAGTESEVCKFGKSNAALDQYCSAILNVPIRG
jgi:ElaB/YqjD/DUF883 family membrane-anchored ribosome-binding protein